MTGHKKGYRLIGDCEKRYDNYLNGYADLRRLRPGVVIPHGYKEMLSIHTQAVYDKDGVLLPTFRALKRHNDEINRNI